MLRSLFNLSFRYKFPLWGSVLIVSTAGIIIATLLFRAYADLKQDMVHNAASQGQTLAITLFPAMLHDDVWRTYEIVSSPLRGASPGYPAQAKTLLVVNPERQVYVSTQPADIPISTPLERIGPAYASLAAEWDKVGYETRIVEPDGFDEFFVLTPIAEQSAQLGVLVQVFSKAALLPRFRESADQAALIVGLVLAVLLPINWYWGQRTAEPLVRVAASMESLGRGDTRPLPMGIYGYKDEIGRLFETYNRTAEQLREKESLAREIVRSERLAAIGRLSAGIAHEVNNPLAGMLTTINTLKRRPNVDAKVLKTIDLVERGLSQIGETVRALLVEAKVSTRPLTRADIEDVRTLLNGPIVKKNLDLAWEVSFTGTMPLPASQVRQILINLLFNAIHAAPTGGRLRVSLDDDANGMRIEVRNDGEPLTTEQFKHLFEPFYTTEESGHGLGLWITYQTVHQLGGHIDAANDDGQVRFSVEIPLESSA